MTTESFLRGKIADTITENEVVPFTKAVSKVPKLTKGFITVSPDTDSEEIMFYDGVTGTPGEAGTITITNRGYNTDNETQLVGNQKRHTLNAEFKGALNHIIINRKADLDDAKFTGELRVPVFADAAARDAAITSPEDGLLVYLQDVEDFASYKNGIWIIGLGGGGSATYYQDSTGDGTLVGVVDGVNTTFTLSHAPASPTAVVVMYNGIVQELGATDDYTITGLDITFNTAPVSGKVTAIYPDTPVGSGNSQTREIPAATAVNGELFRNTDDSSNLYYKDESGDLTKLHDDITGRIDIPQSTDTILGVNTITTDAEYKAGVDNVKTTTSKQAKDNYSSGLVNGGKVTYNGTTSETSTLVIPLGRENVKTVSFCLSAFGWRDPVTGNYPYGFGKYVATFALGASGIDMSYSYIEEGETASGPSSLPDTDIELLYNQNTTVIGTGKITSTLTQRFGGTSTGFEITDVFVDGSDLKLNYTIFIDGTGGLGAVTVGPVTIIN